MLQENTDNTDRERLPLRSFEDLEIRVQERTAELAKVNEQMALVDEVAQIVTSTLNIDEVYELFALEVRKLVDFDRASINIIDQGAGTVTLKYLFGPAREGRSVGTVSSLQGTENQTVAETGQTLRRVDAAGDPQYPSDPVHGNNGMHATMRTPLFSKGRVIGSMSLRSKQVGAFGPSQQTILERIASQIAPAVANVQLYEEIKEEIAVVNEVARVITSALNIEEVYGKFALELKKLVDFERASINLVDQEAGTYVLKYLYGPARPGVSVGSVNRLESITMQRVVTMAQTVVWDDHSGVRDEYIKMGLRSRLLVPLISKGQVIGTLGLRSLRVGAYGSREQAIVERLAGQIAPAIANAAAYQELFSPRELEVLEQLTMGYSNNQIAEVLSITPNTVFTHVRHIKT